MKLTKGKDSYLHGLDKGFNMRSSWEVIMAEWLDVNKYSWKYEPRMFRTEYGMYHPDFYIAELDIYVEVKVNLIPKVVSKMYDFVRQCNELVFVDDPNIIDLERRWCVW